jgi:hypothetical protein
MPRHLPAAVGYSAARLRDRDALAALGVVRIESYPSMSWAVGTGTDQGAPIIVSIDARYRDPRTRAGRSTCIAIRFLGGYMLRSVENRTAFEESFEPVLKKYGGVLVAGITQTQPVSYTFIAYCESECFDSDEVPILEELRRTTAIRVSHDPGWEEYESWLWRVPTGLGKILNWLKMLGTLLGYKISTILEKRRGRKDR